jgi:EAL domain-containing protein (putative c-di-GMP-specific phosphodiesterase class I)
MTALVEPFRVEGYELSMSASVGVSLGPKDGTGFEALSRCADAALNRAKTEGRNAIRFYSEGMQALSAQRMQMLTYLRRAIEMDELILHYQPQVSFATGEVVGVEALLRWQHPDLGLLAPDSFISLAEDSGVILSLGEWVLARALQDAAAWPRGSEGDLSVAVNISAVEFLQNDLPARIGRALDESGFPAERLELEITETVAMRNPDAAAVMIDRLRQIGVQMAIDDFGTGYSSMAYLKRFRINKIKIDRSFVKDLGRDPDDEAIVRAIVQLAKSLRCTTIAEGVETDIQRTHLQSCQCDLMQGYFFSRPIPQEELLCVLRSHAPVAG